MIKVILFDLDGTVANTNNLIFKSFRHVLETYKIENIEDKTIYSFFGEPLDYTLDRYKSFDTTENLVKCYRAYNEREHDLLIEEFPTVKETLDKMKEKGYKLAIVTSKNRKMATRSLKALDLYDYFDLLVTPEDTLKHKPDKEPCEFALKHFNVKPQESIMVGDSSYDLMSGKSAGCYTIGVNYSLISKDILLSTNPDFMVDEFKDILYIVDTLNETQK